MSVDGSAGTAMLGLGGFVLLAVSEAFGELEQAVETIATSAWCQGCGVAAQPHGRRPVRVRDLPVLWAAGDVAVAQAAVAVRRDGLLGPDVERAVGAGPAAGIVDRTGPR